MTGRKAGQGVSGRVSGGQKEAATLGADGVGYRPERDGELL